MSTIVSLVVTRYLRSLEELCVRAGHHDEARAIAYAVDFEDFRSDIPPADRAEAVAKKHPLAAMAYAVAHVLEREASQGEITSVPMLTWEHCGKTFEAGSVHCDRCWYLRPRASERMRGAV